MINTYALITYALIRDTKTEYHSKLAVKLVNLSTRTKTYRSILKILANGGKVPVIPPLLIKSEYISNFKTKANYFNRPFNQQCTAISKKQFHTFLRQSCNK